MVTSQSNHIISLPLSSATLFICRAAPVEFRAVYFSCFYLARMRPLCRRPAKWGECFHRRAHRAQHSWCGFVWQQNGTRDSINKKFDFDCVYFTAELRVVRATSNQPYLCSSHQLIESSHIPRKLLEKRFSIHSHSVFLYFSISDWKTIE